MQKLNEVHLLPGVAIPWRDYLRMTQPQVSALLLLSAFMTMLLVDDRFLPLSIIFFTLLGGYLAIAGAGMIHCYLDCDLDALMGQKNRRPIPSGRISPYQALRFGLALCGLAFFVLGIGANLFAALLAALGIFVYLFVYIYCFKRRFQRSIVISGAALAIPPLVGWVALTNTLAWMPLLIFLIIFFWVPPYFWSLVLVKRYTYSRAGIPLLPIVQGSQITCNEILHYTILLIIATTLPVFLGFLSDAYLLGALGLGAILFYQARQLRRKPTYVVAGKFHRYTLLYLASIFVVMVFDRQMMGVGQ